MDPEQFQHVLVKASQKGYLHGPRQCPLYLNVWLQQCRFLFASISDLICCGMGHVGPNVQPTHDGSKEGYGGLASVCSARRWALFRMRPKLHLYAHSPTPTSIYICVSSILFGPRRKTTNGKWYDFLKVTTQGELWNYSFFRVEMMKTSSMWWVPALYFMITLSPQLFWIVLGLFLI